MKSVLILVSLGGLVVLAACQTPASPGIGLSATPAGIVQAAQVGTPSSPVNQSVAPGSGAINPAPTAFAPVTFNGDGPLFVAVVQTTKMVDNAGDQQTISLVPPGFAFDLDNRILLLRRMVSAQTMKLGMLVGVATEVATPTVVYERLEILQGASQPRYMQILEVDPATGALSFLYDGQSYSLLPGSSMSFSHAGATKSAASVTTLITNHGRLNGIQSMPVEGPMP